MNKDIIPKALVAGTGGWRRRRPPPLFSAKSHKLASIYKKILGQAPKTLGASFSDPGSATEHL